MKKRIICLLLTVAVAFSALLIWTIIDNKTLRLHEITVHDSDLPDSFDGFCIAHISDLHSAQIGQGNEKLLQLLRDAKPDIIAITGDLIDCRDADPTIAINLCRDAAKIAPVYFITGNHEARLSEDLYNRLLDELQSAGVVLLLDQEQIIAQDDASISIVGHRWGETDNLAALSDFDGFTILLSHQPEDISNYAAADFDLVLSGHAHGGQFRLPFVGGLFAPGQGIFPEYDAGLYLVDETQMVVSRGIGNSSFPLRFNNSPEIILIRLES